MLGSAFWPLRFYSWMVRIPPVAVTDSEVHLGVVLQRHRAGSSAMVSLLTSCLFGIHTSLKDSAKPYLAEPWTWDLLPTFYFRQAFMPFERWLVGQKWPRNLNLLLPHLPVSPFASSQPCPLLLLFSKWWQRPEVAIMSPWKETPSLKPANRR